MTSVTSPPTTQGTASPIGQWALVIKQQTQALLGRSGTMLLVGAIVMFCMSGLSLVYARAGEPLAAYWTAGGALLALCLGLPKKYTPWLLGGGILGNLAAEFLFTVDPAIKSIGLSLCHVGEIALATVVLRRLWKGEIDVLRGRSLYLLGLTAGAVSLLFSLLVGPVLAAAGELSSFGAVASRWFLAETLGILVATPPMLLLLTRKTSVIRVSMENGLLVGAALALTLAVVYLQTDFPVMFMIAPVLMLVAVRCGARMTAIALLFTTVVAIMASASGLGPLALINEASMTVRGFIQMLFLAGVVMTTLPTAGLLEDRHEAARKAMVEAETLSMAKSLAVLGHWRLDGRTGQFTCSDETYRIHGVEPGTVDPTEYMRSVPYHPDDRLAVEAARERAFKTGEGYDLTLRVLRPDGEVRFTRSRAKGQLNSKGEVVGLFGVVQDITEEVRLKKEQAATLDRLKLAESLSGMGYWRMGVVDRELEWSDAMYAIHGLKPGEIAPRDYAQHVTYDPRDLAESQRKTAELLEGGAPFETRVRFTLKSGDRRTALLKVDLERGSDGTPVAIYGVQQDITDSVRRTEELAKMVDTLKLAEQTAGVGHWRYDASTRELSWSDVVYDIHGLPRGEDFGGNKGALAFFDAEEQERLSSAVLHTIETGEPFSLKLTLTRKDQQERVVVTQGTREKSVDGQSFSVIGVIQDVTEHDKAAARLAESEAQYRGLADRSTDLIISYGLDGLVTYVSPAIRDLKGLEPEEVIGRPVTSLIHPDDVAELSMQLGTFIASGGVGVHQSQYRSLDADGNVRWYEARASLIRDEFGRVKAVQDIVRDVTSTKAMQQALIEARDTAESAARSKSEFLANMSHELRTPLTSVIGFSGLLQASTTLGETERRFVNRISTSSEALLVVINDILDYSKLEANAIELEPLPFGPHQLADDVASILESQRLAKGLDLVLEVDATMPDELVGDVGRLRQVLLNFASNAVKFTAEGTVTVRLGGVAHPGGWLLRGEVVDTGIGIEPEKIDELFERFTQADASTTRDYGGTGLGLAISRRLVTLMGGDIGAYSQPGQGSTFWFEVPLGIDSANEMVGSRVDPAFADPLQTGSLAGARILVADDSPANRELVTMVLRGLGLTVEAVRDGAEAVAAIQTGKHDLVLMDIQMPVMDGVTATRKIRMMKGAKGKIPILALTANSGEDKVEKYLAAGMNGHVTKPLRIADLAKAIGEGLAGRDKRKRAA